MAGGAYIAANGHGNKKEDRITVFVMMISLVAATGGLFYGYDIGISGGATSMDDFLTKFFPDVLRQRQKKLRHETEYCKYDKELYTLFNSCLYLSALFASFLSSTTTRICGRKLSMMIGSLAFLSGALLNGLAVNLEMLIIGRLLLGVGVGFANQSVPIYLSEIAPAKIRGTVNVGFELAITIGVLVANIVNHATLKLKHGLGWRLSLGLAGVPAIIMFVGSFFLPETPISILERGNEEKAKKILQRIRGTDDVEHEFKALCKASESSKGTKNPWMKIMQARYRPQLVLCTFIPLFQQLTGVNVIMFYVHFLFHAIGLGHDASFMSTLITGIVSVVSTFVSLYSVDKFGRRALFLQGGIQMMLSQIAVGSLIAWKVGLNGHGTLSPVVTNVILALICLYVSGFAWSWGPLGWFVPSEICPLEVRSAGQSMNVSVNMFLTFIIGQFFLTMFCRMKFCLFFFFAGMHLIMTIFIYFLLPETKGVPIEEMQRVWKEHKIWGKYSHDVNVCADDYVYDFS